MPINVVDPNPPNYVDETSRAPGHYGKPYILVRIFDLLVLMIDILQKTAASQASRLNFLTQWQKAYTDQLNNSIHSFTAGNGDQEGTLRSAGLITDPHSQGDSRLPTVRIGNETRSYLYAKATFNPQESASLIESVPYQGILISGSHSSRNDPRNNELDANLDFNQLYRSVSTNRVGDAWIEGPSRSTNMGSEGGIDGSSAAAVAEREKLTQTNATYTQQIQGNLNIISNDAKSLQANVNQSNDAVQAQADMATSILQQMSTILTAIYQSG